MRDDAKKGRGMTDEKGGEGGEGGEGSRRKEENLEDLSDDDKVSLRIWRRSAFDQTIFSRVLKKEKEKKKRKGVTSTDEGREEVDG